MSRPDPPGTSPDDAPASRDARVEQVADAVRAWTRHLSDLGGPNTLLWHRDLPAGEIDLTMAHPGGISMLLAGHRVRLSDLVREPQALEEARVRARAIARVCRDLRAERGLEVGFVGVGMATWTVRTGSGAVLPRSPAAPVLLRPCVLRPTDPLGGDYVLDLGRDIELNPALVHYLATAHALAVDAHEVERAAVSGTGLDPYPAYAALTRLCERVPGFTVSPRLLLGTFSYAKLPMVADLGVVGAERLARNDVVAALAGVEDALPAVAEAEPSAGAADHVPDPARGLLVLDADSAQRGVVEAVLAGHDLVVDTPPGTGASQTVANVVAGLAGAGKSVLVVAEARSALDDVVGRLHQVGLADLVLDLPGGALDTRRALEELAARLEGRGGPPTDPGSAIADRLRSSATALREHVEGLHETRAPWGVSAYDVQEAIGRLAGLPHPPRSRVRLHGADLAALDRAGMLELVAALEEVARRGAWRETRGGDPWFGASIATEAEAAQARERVERLADGAVQHLADVVDEVFADVHLPELRTVRDWGETLSTVARVRDTLEVFRPEVFDVPLEGLVAATAPKAERTELRPGWWERQGLRRQARRLLRPGAPPPDLHAALQDANRQRVAWRALVGAGGRPEMPAELDRARAAYDLLADDLAWLDERLARIPDRPDSLFDTDRSILSSYLRALAATPERLAVLPAVHARLARLESAGLRPLVIDLARRAVAPGDVGAELEFVWWASVGEEVAEHDPRVGRHDGEQLRRDLETFAAADRQHLTDNATRVRAAVHERTRAALAAHPEQVEHIRSEAVVDERPTALRDLVAAIADVALAAKPCWAMSPLVVASVLPPGEWFDVVVVDGAERLASAEAVSALSRGRQVLLLGDPRQAGPSSFVTTVTDDASSAPAEPRPEAVLARLAPLLPARKLLWHYRSRDERLVEFVNARVYDGALRTLPGVRTGPAVTLERVETTGVVTPGSAAVESTAAEVERAVELALEHARTRAAESLAVLALNPTHARLVEEALRTAVAGAEPEVAAFFTEDVFEQCVVTGPRSMQGQERDAVILTVGYGKTPHGRVLHRFGALAGDDGAGLVAVALTRARRRLIIVSSIGATDLDPDKLGGPGMVLLRDLLSYAAGEVAEHPHPADGPVVMAELARRLREHGLVVHERVGAGEHPVDLAVEDPHRPGRLLVAVESDGPAHARIRDPHERDRLRPEQLERLGWAHVRVFSTDVFRDPARDVERVRHAAEDASRHG